MKKSIGTETYLFPLPAVVVSTYDKEGKENMMTASWAGIVNSVKPMLSISMRKATHSHDSVIHSRAFTVNIPSINHLLEMDYVGTKSGKNENMFELTGLTAIKSELVNAPYVEEFPLVLECKLVKYEELGLHTMFIGEIVDVKVEEGYTTESGNPDIKKLNPVAYAHGEREYFEVGKYLGKANRMWQNTTMNEMYRNGKKREVLELILEYYKKLDEGYPIEAFEKIFNWDCFVMNNGELHIDSKEKYISWYEEVRKSVFNRKHILESLVMEEKEDMIEVHMDMYFRANTWDVGDAKTSDISAKSKINWTVKWNEEEARWMLEEYQINML